MQFQNVTEFALVEVLDRAIPNKECIAIRVKEKTETGAFGIVLGIYAENGYAKPLLDHFFWFGDGVVQEGDWIFVNTGDGDARLNRSTDDKNDVYSMFWKKKNTVFANTNIVPIIFRIESVVVGAPPPDKPQLRTLTAK